MKKNSTAQGSRQSRRTAGSARVGAVVRRARAPGLRQGRSARTLRLESILVPIDFSTPSKKALSYAVSFAERFGAKLTLLHVVEPAPMPDFARMYPVLMENDKLLAGAKSQLERLLAREAIAPAHVEKTLVRLGRSFQEIAEAARTLKVDLIIISTHGYTGLKRALLGSTTERVVRHAPCPVLVVRDRAKQSV